MGAETLVLLQKNAYLVITILLCVFLYSYIAFMYRSEKKGTKDYEKYARLALDDAIGDEVIEKR